MRILFVVPYAPTRIRTRPYHLVRALAALGHEIVVGTVWSDADEEAAIEALGTWPGVTAVIATRVSPLRSAWNMVAALPGTGPLQARYSWSPALMARLAARLERHDVDVVHVEHLRGVHYALSLAAAADRRAGGRPPVIVWDAVDCISRLFRLTAGAGEPRTARLAARLELARTERCEGTAAQRFDRVLVTSDRDADDLCRLADTHGEGGRARVEVLPNGLDLAYFSPGPAPREPATLVVSGKMSYHANVTAACWLVRDVMPRIWAHRPDVRVWIVGKDPLREVRNLAADGPTDGQGRRVLVTGTVDDIRPYLRAATVAVAPIRYGVGIQNKVLEACGCAAPVLATPAAVDGLDARPGEDLLVAADAGEFAASALRLLADPPARARLGRAARRFVERRHDWRVVGRRLVDIYADAFAERAGHLRVIHG